MTTESVIVQLPAPVVAAMRQLAELSGRSVEEVIERSLVQSLPDLEGVPPNEARELAALHLLDDTSLWREAKAMLSKKDQQSFHELLELQGAGDLDEQQKDRLRDLLDKYERVTERKAYALMLLARRGYRVPFRSAQRSS